MTIFVFHKVLEEKSAFYHDVPDQCEFAQILDWIAEQFTVVRLMEAIDALDAGKLPARAAAITFDDGNGIALSCSAPLLDQKRIPATFFVNTAYLEGGAPFFERIYKALEQTNRETLDLTTIDEENSPIQTPGQRRALADELCEKAKYMTPTAAENFANIIEDICQVDSRVRMVSAQEVQKPWKWIDFGGHSHHHSILTTLDSNAAMKELLTCKEIISDLTGNSEPLFAFPNGKPKIDFTNEHEYMLRRLGFKAAFACSRGAMSKSGNRFSVPRFTAWDKTRLKFQTRMLMNLFSA